jgi:hypothetical protein
MYVRLKNVEKLRIAMGLYFPTEVVLNLLKREKIAACSHRLGKVF